MELLVGMAGWPIIGSLAKWGLRALFGITDEPNIVFLGERPVIEPSDKRPAYQSWYHLAVENKQRAGRSRRLLTREADCDVHIQVTPNVGSVKTFHAVFLVSDTEMPRAPFILVPDRPTKIPVYLVADEEVRIESLGRTIPPGAYVTDSRFLSHPDLLEECRLAPGNYDVAVIVKWRGGRESARFSITILARGQSATPAGS